jgi:hypothetical protein
MFTFLSYFGLFSVSVIHHEANMMIAPRPMYVIISSAESISEKKSRPEIHRILLREKYIDGS